MDHQEIFTKSQKHKIIAVVVVAVALITLWFMMDLVIMTFILTFVFYHLVRVEHHALKKFFHITAPKPLLALIDYAAVIWIIVELLMHFGGSMVSKVFGFVEKLMLFDYAAAQATLPEKVVQIIGPLDFAPIISRLTAILGAMVQRGGQVGLDLILAIIISLAILLELRKIRRFGVNMGNSDLAFLYRYIVKFGTSFSRTFGTVMRVQVVIALINSIISTICLHFMGFPSVAALGLMIFCLGLIPVAGVIISLVPLCFIAFSVGGWFKVLEVLIMIVVVHAIETYILNPQLMSNRTKLPVSFVFIILLVGQQYMGVWGMLCGVPIFLFLMDAFSVDYAVSKETPAARRRRLKVAARNAAQIVYDSTVEDYAEAEAEYEHMVEEAEAEAERIREEAEEELERIQK